MSEIELFITVIFVAFAVSVVVHTVFELVRLKEWREERKRITRHSKELERRYRDLKRTVDGQMEDNAEAMKAFRRLSEAARRYGCK